MKKHNRILTLSITAVFFALLSFRISTPMEKAENLAVDLPEEAALISADSLCPDVMVAYRSGNTIHFGFKH